MRRIRNQHSLARISLLLQVRADQQEARKFSLRTCSRLQSDGVHSGNFQQTFFQQPKDFQAALRKFLRLVRMFGCNSFEPRHKFVHARVVLHGAGTQRVHAKVNGVVPGRKPSEVADHFDFADFGKPFNTLPAVMRAKRVGRFRFGHVQRRQFERALSGRRFLEDQPFVLVHVPRSFFDITVHFVLNGLF